MPRNLLVLTMIVVAQLFSLGGQSVIAAETTPIVKVALLDMSAVMGMGTVGMANPGMMGPGMGMMGMGMMGPGMGMMGMGMMTIRADRDSIKAGAVTFDVSNWSRSTIHELVLVSVDNSSTPLPYDYSQAKVREDQVKIVTETSELQPSQSASLQANLAPGSYLLICNIPGHYALGMATFLTVSP